MNVTTTPAPVSSRALAATLHFLPFLLVPASANNLSNLVSVCTFIGCFSLTYKGAGPAVLRVVLFIIAAYFGHPLVTADHEVPHRMVSTGIAFSGALMLLKALDVCVISLWDQEPPHWLRNGKRVPLPDTLFGRLVYSFDLLTTNRGSSWFDGYSWDWAPKYIALYSPPVRSRMSNTMRSLAYFVYLYLVMDVLETLTQSENWNIHQPHPILSLSIPEQLFYSFAICLITFVGIILSHRIFSTIAVALGNTPKAWVPVLRDPFASSSLQDFWSNRWHHSFKRPVERFVIPIMMLVPQRWPWSTRRVIRAFLIFGFQTIFHLYLVSRCFHGRKSEMVWSFVDQSTLLFFLLQPIGLLIERELLVPLSKALLPASPNARTWVTRAWVWGWLLWTGRYWADVWVRSGMWNPGEGYLAWSPVRGVLFGKWFLI
ncbi:hypothetical protein DL93DRAFT_2087838 [Clavulina sp. PMI_390]|nr:hypothetical protein DL93DRAFT_2087838 [Clavulina sp. PMI_390]